MFVFFKVAGMKGFDPGEDFCPYSKNPEGYYTYRDQYQYSPGGAYLAAVYASGSWENLPEPLILERHPSEALLAWMSQMVRKGADYCHSRFHRVFDEEPGSWEELERKLQLLNDLLGGDYKISVHRSGQEVMLFSPNEGTRGSTDWYFPPHMGAIEAWQSIIWTVADEMYLLSSNEDYDRAEAFRRAEESTLEI